MTDDARPKPPIAADVDLRDYRWMPLDVVRLRDSETWMLASITPFAAVACINLWCKAWHQVPAGSLPNNDDMHRIMAGVPNWDDVRDIALRNFVECSDGRLYHTIICEKAKEAFKEKERYRKAANARWKKKKTNNATHDAPKEDAYSDASKKDAKTHMQETGTRTGTIPSVSKDTSGPPQGSPHDDDQDFELIPLASDRRPEGDAVRRWNDMAERKGLPKVQKLTEKRRRSLRRRLDDCGGLDGWDAALGKVEASPFLLGENDRGWRADFDFLLQESSFTKLMEGAYDRGGGGGTPGGQMRDAFDDLYAELGSNGGTVQ